MNPIFLYLVTPNLGLLRNFVKYKQFSFKTYIRTYIAYFYFHLLLFMFGIKNVVLATLITERWFWFLFKSFKSIQNNDYYKKKEKYIIKYNMDYKK